jgi:hypothetical protein
MPLVFAEFRATPNRAEIPLASVVLFVLRPLREHVCASCLHLWVAQVHGGPLTVGGGRDMFMLADRNVPELRRQD